MLDMNTVGTQTMTYRKKILPGIDLCSIIGYIYNEKFPGINLCCVMNFLLCNVVGPSLLCSASPSLVIVQLCLHALTCVLQMAVVPRW